MPSSADLSGFFGCHHSQRVHSGGQYTPPAPRPPAAALQNPTTFTSEQFNKLESTAETDGSGVVAGELAKTTNVIGIKLATPSSPPVGDRTVVGVNSQIVATSPMLLIKVNGVPIAV